MYHIIFSYNSTIIKLSKSTVTSNLINQYWEDTDPGYVDWSTKKLKLGDVVKYINDEGTKKTIGTVSASTIATRVTVTSTISDDVVERFATTVIRQYTLLLVYEITTGGQYSENVFKQLSNIAERVKVIFSGGQSSTEDEYFNGVCESVEYERDDEDQSKARVNITLTVQRLES